MQRGRQDQPLGLAKAHRDFAERIPAEVESWIPKEDVPEFCKKK